MQRIAVVAFDYYGTLEEIHTEEQEIRAFQTLCNFMRYQGAEYTPHALRRLMNDLMKQEAERQCAAHVTGKPVPEGVKPFSPEPDVLKVLHTLYARCGVQAEETLLLTTAQVFRAACTTFFRLYPGTVEMLTVLRRAGKRIALFSNAQSGYTRPELQAVGLADAFDAVFISSECGAQKPSAAFYQRLIDWANVPPQCIMMVGNSPTDDILPACGMGLRTCYVHSGLTAKDAARPASDLYLPQPDMPALTELLLHARLPEHSIRI